MPSATPRPSWASSPCADQNFSQPRSSNGPRARSAKACATPGTIRCCGSRWRRRPSSACWRSITRPPSRSSPSGFFWGMHPPSAPCCRSPASAAWWGHSWSPVGPRPPHGSCSFAAGAFGVALLGLSAAPNLAVALLCTLPVGAGGLRVHLDLHRAAAKERQTRYARQAHGPASGGVSRLHAHRWSARGRGGRTGRRPGRLVGGRRSRRYHRGGHSAASPDRRSASTLRDDGERSVDRLIRRPAGQVAHCPTHLGFDNMGDA